jgi:hypothetical protein
MHRSASDIHPARRPAQLLVALALLTIALAVAASPARAQQSGPGGPVLVITQGSNAFSAYYSEILRAEGLNAFAVRDISSVDAGTLNGFDVAILGEMPLDPAQAAMFGTWVNAGGNLIAMRPDADLAPLLGLTAGPTSRADAYLKVDTSTAPGAGIADETMQYHGLADNWTLNGATSVATLYSDASTATANPAVTLRDVGTSGGQAAAFTYDLARSVVYTRQGNPAWAGQERDGITPIRSNDLFFGIPAQADWIDFSKVAIPQADEQQRLLANLVTMVAADRKPLPRFWYLPRDEKAAIVMTGDDHGNRGSATVQRFNSFTAASVDCNLAEWECIRGTSYVYPGVITAAEAASLNAAGFEIGLHVTTGCADFTGDSLRNDFTTQLGQFRTLYPTLPAITTNRTHCIPWSDWATHATVEGENGIRLDTNYYYFGPTSWNVGARPGFFTGSGFPMPFAHENGAKIDVYQAATQMTDESGQEYPATVTALLDGAVGASGYYGVFTANMHTDGGNTASAESAAAIVSSAQARGVPVVTARQMLTWLDGRNNSSFSSIASVANTLSFTVNAAAGSDGLRGMVPATSGGGALVSMTRNGSAIPTTRQTIKGVAYEFFDATSGSYVATYAGQAPPPPPPPASTGGSSTGAGSTGSTGSTGTPGSTGSNNSSGSSSSIGCLTLTSSTRRVRVGRRTVLTAKVRRRGRGAARVRVRLTGPGLRATTKRTNRAGNARFTVRTRRKGTLRLRALGQAPSCKAPVVLVRAR